MVALSCLGEDGLQLQEELPQGSNTVWTLAWGKKGPLRRQTKANSSAFVKCHVTGTAAKGRGRLRSVLEAVVAFLHGHADSSQERRTTTT